MARLGIILMGLGPALFSMFAPETLPQDLQQLAMQSLWVVVPLGALLYALPKFDMFPELDASWSRAHVSTKLAVGLMLIVYAGGFVYIVLYFLGITSGLRTQLRDMQASYQDANQALQSFRLDNSRLETRLNRLEQERSGFEGEIERLETLNIALLTTAQPIVGASGDLSQDQLYVVTHALSGLMEFADSHRIAAICRPLGATAAIDIDEDPRSQRGRWIAIRPGQQQRVGVTPSESLKDEIRESGGAECALAIATISDIEDGGNIRATFIGSATLRPLDMDRQ